MNKYEKILRKYFGHKKFRNKQLDIIKSVLNGKDVCVVMATGAGKSMCYQYPSVYTIKITIVISPLISLMNDQMIKLNKLNIPTICVNSTVGNKNTILQEIIDNKYRLVYMTPEYLIGAKGFIKKLNKKKLLTMIAIDECHCISDWGHQFRPSYKELKCLRKWVPSIPIGLYTATATLTVQNDIINIMNLNKPKIFRSSFDRPNIYLKVSQKSKNIMDDLLPYLNNDESTIIYCQTRKQTEYIVSLLKKENISCGFYHAGMYDMDREFEQNEFMIDKIKVMVATVSMGMGIDKIIRKIIHYGLPPNLSDYVQKTGRAGRDNKPSECILFYSLNDINTNSYFINQIKDRAYMEHQQKLSAVMKKYIYLDSCRRKYILAYFGEEYEKDNCESCDNCKKDAKSVKKDFTKEATLLLNIVYETGNKYGMNMLIDILRGSRSKKVLPKFRKMKEYGNGIMHKNEWWKIFGRMLINNGYMGEEPIPQGHGSSIYRTVKGGKWLRKKDKMILPVPVDLLNLNKSVKIVKTSNNNNNNTVNSTYDMFHNQNMTIEDIAKKRNIKISTIEDHIVKAYQADKELDMNKLKFTDDIYQSIHNRINEMGKNTKLRYVKRGLPNISYLQIKLAKTRMIKEAVKNNIDDNKDDDESDSDESYSDESDSDDDNIKNIIIDKYFQNQLRKKRKKEKVSDKLDDIYDDYKEWVMKTMIDKSELKEYIESKGYKHMNKKMIGLKLVHPHKKNI